MDNKVGTQFPRDAYGTPAIRRRNHAALQSASGRSLGVSTVSHSLHSLYRVSIRGDTSRRSTSSRIRRRHKPS
jgi:hypothetical protein